MGFLGFLKAAGKPEGIREAMRRSYRKHRALATSRQELDPHSIGLYGALATRYRLLRRASSEVEVWCELAPFLGMPEPESIEALAEYIVYQEWRAAANRELLKTSINRSLSSEGKHLTLAPLGLANHAPWSALLDPEVHARVKAMPVDQPTERTERGIRPYATNSMNVKRAGSTRYFNEGVSLVSRGRHEEALKQFDLAVSADPTLEEAWFNKGNVLYSLGRSEDALICYERAPGISQAWCNMGVILRRLGRYEEGLTCYESALRLNADDKTTWLNRGVVLTKLGRHDEALQSYDRAIALDNDFADAWVNKAGLLGQCRRYEEAVKCFNRGLALNPSDSLGWMSKGNMLCDRAQWLEALSCYEQALRINRHLEQAWIEKGACLRQLNNPVAAMECFDEVLRLNPRNANAWFDKGLALMAVAKDFNKAKSCFEEADRLGHRSAKALASVCNRCEIERN